MIIIIIIVISLPQKLERRKKTTLVFATVNRVNTDKSIYSSNFKQAIVDLHHICNRKQKEENSEIRPKRHEINRKRLSRRIHQKRFAIAKKLKEKVFMRRINLLRMKTSELDSTCTNQIIQNKNTCYEKYGFVSDPKLTLTSNSINALRNMPKKIYFNSPSNMTYHNLCIILKPT